MGLANQNYMSTYKDKLPFGYAGRPDSSPGKPNRSFQKRGVFTEMLKFMEEAAIYEGITFDYGVENQKSGPQIGTKTPNPFADGIKDSIVAGYICPSWVDPAIASGKSNDYENGALLTYMGNGGARSNASVALIANEYPDNGPFTLDEITVAPKKIFGKQRKGAEITDGQSKTILIGEFVHRDCNIGLPCDETPGNVRPWYLAGFQAREDMVPSVYSYKELEYPPNTQVTRSIAGWNRLPMGSYHPGVTLFTFVDGSVRIIADDVLQKTYQAMATVNGGEIEGG